MAAHPRSSSRFALLALLLFGAAPALRGQEPAPLPSSILTGFDPRADGFRFENTGDSAERAGNCWGMSLLSIDAYRRRRAAGGEAVDPGANFRQFPSQVDPVTQATASFVQSGLNRFSGSIPPGPAPSDPSSIRAALERVQATGDPQVMLLDGPTSGHAVVLFGYRDGALQVYDPNFPGETIAWPWSPTTGLGRHPKPVPPGKADDFYNTLIGVGAVPFEAHPMAATLSELRAVCSAAGKCLDRYAPVTSTVRSGPRGVTVRGQVGAAPDGARPDRVYLVINGVPAAAAVPSRFGTFTLPTLPARVLRGDGTDVVRVVSQSDGVFAGFAEVTLPPELRGAAGAPAGRAPGRAPSAPTPTRGLAGALGGR